MKRFVVGRLAWTMLAGFLLLSAAFFAIALTPDPNKLFASMAAAEEARQTGGDPKAAAERAMAAYEQARNRDRSLLVRYWDWVSGYATMRWGWSFAYGTPVEAVVARAAPVTLAYTVPAILLSWLVTVLGGTYAAVREGLPDRVGRLVTYLGLGLPAVILAAAITTYNRVGLISVPQFDPSLGLLAPHNLGALAIPAGLVAFSILVTQWRAVRTTARELVDEDFMRSLRAEGATTRRVVRHVLKNATAPILAVSVSQVLMVLFLGIYVVEVLLGIPGLGSVTIRAFEERDIGLILAVVLLPAYVGLLGNLMSDLVAGVVDPRVSATRD